MKYTDMRTIIVEETDLDPDSTNIPRGMTINPIKQTVLEDNDSSSSEMLGFAGTDEEQVLKSQGDVDIESEYRFVDIIGRGGMGIISRATQVELGREVAMKRLHPSLAHSALHQKSFLDEAMVLGHLDHPNIVPVYGCTGGKEGDADLALAMKLVGGKTWDELIHESPQGEVDLGVERNYNEHFGILLNVCNAVAFAHNRGIIHRDIKPENIMVGEFGEVLLMDWGIAVSIDDDLKTDVEAAGDLPHKSNATGLVGTPGYLAPEMATTKSDQLGPWTDIYLLGAVLFEVFAGESPNQGGTILELLESVARGDEHDYPDAMPSGIKEICQKAMALEPQDRYQTAVEFRDAVQLYMAHRESIAVSDQARHVLDRCRDASNMDGSTLYSAFNESIAGFLQALRLWEGNQSAIEGESEARIAYARTALESGDLLLAEAQVEHLDDSKSNELKLEISRAIEERKKAGLASKTLKRTILSAAALVLVLLVSGGFMLMSMNSLNAKIASDAGDKLIHRAEEYLHRTSEQSAYAMQLNIGKVRVALQSLTQEIIRVMDEDNEPEELGVSDVIWGPDIDAHGTNLPGFYEDPEYGRTSHVTGEAEPNPISFDQLSYSVSKKSNPEAVMGDVVRCEQLLPMLKRLHVETEGTVKRYWAAFETGLLFLYPAAGHVPEEYDPTNRQRYKDALNSRQITQSMPYQHFGTNQVVITFAQMVRDNDDHRFGQMGLHVNVEDLVPIPELPFDWKDAAEVRILQIHKDADGIERLKVVADEEYQTQYDRTLSKYDVTLGTLESFGKRDWILSELKSGHSGVGRDLIDGVPMLFAFAPVQEGINKNSYLITIPEAVVTKPAEGFAETIRIQARTELFNLGTTILVVFVLVLLLILLIPRILAKRAVA